MRETWVQGPALIAAPIPRATPTFCRDVLAYMPITGLAELAAGLASLVIRVIGTSIAMVLMFAPLKRLMP